AEATFRAHAGSPHNSSATNSSGSAINSAGAVGLAQVSRALAQLRTLRAHAVAVGSRTELLRAARHFEAAAAAVAEGAVMAAQVSLHQAPLPPPGWCVTACAPARVDLSGGWSDTPPLCWEAQGGGAVLNVAVALGTSVRVFGVDTRGKSCVHV
ncbi:hypothetical protein T492DRAFT_842571, partial [Pavlovales sp. CCMP2436]